MKTNWLLACAVVTIYGLIARIDGPSDIDTAQAVQADKEDAEAMASRQFVAQKVCGNGVATWADDKTLTCGKRKPLMLARAKL